MLVIISLDCREVEEACGRSSKINSGEVRLWLGVGTEEPQHEVEKV